MSDSWSEEEIRLIVHDYFAMLKLEINSEEYNKSDHRRILAPKLHGRSEGSIERKHQNISAIMIHLGMPYIDGYKPLVNYQRNMFPGLIAQMLSENNQLLCLIAEDVEQVPDIPSVEDVLSILENPPSRPRRETIEVSSESSKYRIKTNYLAKEASNSALGAAGELLIMKYEKARLVHLGKENLADRIERVSDSRGDQEGFDILSFNHKGEDRYIEVKTTKYGKETPFFVSRNEKLFSSKFKDMYFLYRLFKFRSAPGLYTVQGSLESNYYLIPTAFRAEIT